MSKICMSMAVYNALEWLKNVSIPSILNQSFKEWKLYIVFDGVTQENLDTCDYLKELNDPRIDFSFTERVLPNPPFPVGSNYWNIAGWNAVNHGLELIRERESDCEIIAHIDQDDYWLPNHLDVVVKTLEEKTCNFVYSKTRHYQNNNFSEMLGDGVWSKERLKSGNFIAHSSIAYRKNTEHEYFYSGDNSMPSDYQHLLSFECEMKSTEQMTALYFQRCSIEFAKQEIERRGK